MCQQRKQGNNECLDNANKDNNECLSKTNKGNSQCLDKTNRHNNSIQIRHTTPLSPWRGAGGEAGLGLWRALLTN